MQIRWGDLRRTVSSRR